MVGPPRREDTEGVTPRPLSVQAESDLVRHCSDGLPVDALRTQLLSSIRRLMPVDAAFFATADPETLLFTGGYAEDPLRGATAEFLANEFGSEDVNKFATLARSDSHVATLDAATRRVRAASARSLDIMQPLGLGDELRMALVTGGRCWGYLCLHRDSGELGFTSSEVAVMTRVAPRIAYGLRQATLLHTRPGAAAVGAPGIVVLSEDLTVVAITAEAEHLLSLVDDDGRRGAGLPMVVYGVAHAAKTAGGEIGVSVAPASSRVRAADGQWLSLHGSRLRGGDDDHRIAVVVEPGSAQAVMPVLLAGYGLSSREAQVATLVLRGESTLAIVDLLHISRHTVQDHLKVVFDKAGVRSRRELIGKLLV